MPNNPKASSNLKSFKKGQSGNPNGRPRKFVSQFTSLGYRSSEVHDCLKNMLAMTESELNGVSTDASATVLEKMMARAILNDLRKKTFSTFTPILDRVFGKAVQPIERITPEIRTAVEYYRDLIDEGYSEKDALAKTLALSAKFDIAVTEKDILQHTEAIN